MNIEQALHETECYLKEHQNEIPKIVHAYLVEICTQEKKYIDLMKHWSMEKPFSKLKPV